jgi:Resolvase, N terminal domain
MDRPSFRQLIKDIEIGEVDTLVVWQLDRLGRTAKGLINLFDDLISLFDDLIRWKVNLISLRDGLDLVTPSGRLMANILAGVAAFETEIRAERILAVRLRRGFVEFSGVVRLGVVGSRWGTEKVSGNENGFLPPICPQSVPDTLSTSFGASALHLTAWGVRCQTALDSIATMSSKI